MSAVYQMSLQDRPCNVELTLDFFLKAIETPELYNCIAGLHVYP